MTPHETAVRTYRTQLAGSQAHATAHVLDVGALRARAVLLLDALEVRPNTRGRVLARFDKLEEVRALYGQPATDPLARLLDTDTRIEKASERAGAAAERWSELIAAPLDEARSTFPCGILAKACASARNIFGQLSKLSDQLYTLSSAVNGLYEHELSLPDEDDDEPADDERELGADEREDDDDAYDEEEAGEDDEEASE